MDTFNQNAKNLLRVLQGLVSEFEIIDEVPRLIEKYERRGFRALRLSIDGRKKIVAYKI